MYLFLEYWCICYNNTCVFPPGECVFLLGPPQGGAGSVSCDGCFFLSCLLVFGAAEGLGFRTYVTGSVLLVKSALTGKKGTNTPRVH